MELADTVSRHAPVLDAIRVAAEICRAVQHSADRGGKAQAKAGDEPVTVADYAAQAIVLRAVGRAFPEDRVLAEESGANLREGAGAEVRERVLDLLARALGTGVDVDDACGWLDQDGGGDEHTWTVDPIDGTRGFLRGDQYCVAVARLRAGVPVFAALACPNLAGSAAPSNVPAAEEDEGRGVLFVAEQGCGAWTVPLFVPLHPATANARGQRVYVREVPSVRDLRLLGSVEAAHGDPALLAALAEALGLRQPIVRVDSQVKYGVLARGDAEVYLRPRNRPERRENVWDHAPGVLVATEAGGVATDLDGTALDFGAGRRLERNRGVLVSNGPHHGELVEALRRIERDARRAD